MNKQNINKAFRPLALPKPSPAFPEGEREPEASLGPRAKRWPSPQRVEPEAKGPPLSAASQAALALDFAEGEAKGPLPPFALRTQALGGQFSIFYRHSMMNSPLKVSALGIVEICA